MRGIRVFVLVGFTCCAPVSYARGCDYSDRYSEGAIECEEATETEESFDKDYATGVAESRMWKSAFAHCRKLGELHEEDLIPVPIAASQKSSSKNLGGARVRYSVSRAFYCGGL